LDLIVLLLFRTATFRYFGKDKGITYQYYYAVSGSGKPDIWPDEVTFIGTSITDWILDCAGIFPFFY
jgi:hypothetical protein